MPFTRGFQERYRIERRLGAGGMGEVFLARDVATDRLVAIKTVCGACFEDGTARERFLQEARITCQLSHEAIIRLLDQGEDDGSLYVIYEYVSGGDLAARLEQGPLSPPLFFSVALPVLDAVAHAHDRGVLHRDIKASNVLLTEANEPRLADFGLAKRLDGGGIRTATGLIMGTPAYMAPELGMGQKATSSTDQYALGVLLYEMLAGRLPLWHENPVVLLTSHIQDRPPRLSGLRPDVPGPLEAAVHRALAKTPDERFARAIDLWHAVHECRDLPWAPIESPAPGPGQTAALSRPRRSTGRSSSAQTVAVSITRGRGLVRRSPWIAGGVVLLVACVLWLARSGKAPAPSPTPVRSAEIPQTFDEVLAALRDLSGLTIQQDDGAHPLFPAFADALPRELDFEARFAAANHGQVENAAVRSGLTTWVARVRSGRSRDLLRRASSLLESPLDWGRKAELFRAIQDLADLEAFAAINGIGPGETPALRCAYRYGDPPDTGSAQPVRGSWVFRMVPESERDALVGQLFGPGKNRAGVGFLDLKELVGRRVIEGRTRSEENFSATVHEFIGDPTMPGNPLTSPREGPPLPAHCTGLLCPDFYRRNARIDGATPLRSSTYKQDLELQRASHPDATQGAWDRTLACLPGGLDHVELVLVFAASPRVRISLHLAGLPPLLFRSRPEPPRLPWKEAESWTAVAIRLEAIPVVRSARRAATLRVRSYPDDCRFRLLKDNDLVNLWTATLLGLVVRPVPGKR